MNTTSIIGEKSRIHFIGIGGVSMSKLALMLTERGKSVSGSDLTQSKTTLLLQDAGVRVFIGHKPSHIDGAEIVVKNAAISPDNPELCEAALRGIPVMDRAELLGLLTNDYNHSVAVAGAHGKTTACGMLWAIFCEAGRKAVGHIGQHGFEADVLIPCAARSCTAAAGEPDIIIAEACEYKRSFLHIRPELAVVLNIEEDHPDYYKDLSDIKDAFGAFIRGTKEGGACIANGDDQNVRSVISGGGEGLPRIITFGTGRENDYTAKRIRRHGAYFSFDICERGAFLTRVHMSACGRHNIYNALAAAAAARQLGVPPDALERALSSFRGVRRRFERVATLNGAAVIHDYAHHPREIGAVIASARMLKPSRLICVFQPHTYTRTKKLFNDFAEVLSRADITILADIYAAREAPIEGVTSAALAASVPDAIYLAGFPEIRTYLAQIICPNDIVLVLGAGDIVGLFE